MSKIRRMFPGGNTSLGFYSLHDNIIGSDRNMLYILKGMPGGGKSSLMREIARRATVEGYSLEYHHCPSDPESIDGIRIVELAIAIVDGTPPHPIEPVYPGLTGKIVDLGRYINGDLLKRAKEQIIEAKNHNKYAYRKTYNYFKAAKNIYEEIVESNKIGLDSKGISRETFELREKIFSKKTKSVNSKDINERYLFASAYTPEGFVDYTDTILKDVEDIYYLSGEIGNGQSTILTRLLEESKIRNYQIEVYLDPLIPNIIETLFIKDINTIITSNSIGEYLGKIIIDLHKYLDHNSIVEEDYLNYNLLLDNGIKALKMAKENHIKLERLYRPAIDYSEISKIRDEIFNEIMSYK